MINLVAAQITDDQAAEITTQMNMLRTIWMLSGRRKLNATERGMMMAAIEYVEGIIDPDVCGSDDDATV
jgi:hypothetical protein